MSVLLVSPLLYDKNGTVMRKISKFLSIVVLGLLVGGCSQGQKAKQTKTKTETKTSQKASGDLAKLSQGRDLFAWTVYWDVDKP